MYYTTRTRYYLQEVQSLPSSEHASGELHLQSSRRHEVCVSGCLKERLPSARLVPNPEGWRHSSRPTSPSARFMSALHAPCSTTNSTTHRYTFHPLLEQAIVARIESAATKDSNKVDNGSARLPECQGIRIMVVEPARPVGDIVAKPPPLVQSHGWAVGDITKEAALGRDIHIKVEPEHRFIDEYTVLALSALKRPQVR